MGELFALRRILLNLLFTVSAQEPVSQARILAWIEEADNEAVDGAAAVDAGNAPTAARKTPGKNAFPTPPTAVLVLGYGKRKRCRACVRITESDDTHAPYRGAAFRNVRQLPNSDGGSILSFVTPDPANTLVGPTFRMCRAPRRQDRHRTVGRVGTFRRLACVAIQRTFPASLAGLRRESSRRFPRAV